MKRTILSLALICSLFVAYSQNELSTPSNTEIARVIAANQELNKQSAGVVDPNRIFIGQQLQYTFQDGTTKLIAVAKGDNQWTIVKKVLAEEKLHGQVVKPGTTPTPDEKKNEAVLPTISESKSGFMLPAWVWILGAIALTGSLIWWFVRRKEARKDPVRSGVPMRREGVNDENAFAYAQQVAARQFNNPNIQVREVRRGMLSGNNLEVFYAGNVTPQRRTFTNQLAYRGIANLNGADQFVYFLQGCGNDVRMGNFFSGQNIQFIADETIQVPAPQREVTAIEANTSPVAAPTAFQMVTAMTDVLKDKNSGKMTIEDGNVKVEMFFSSGLITFSSNGHAKAEEVKEAVAN